MNAHSFAVLRLLADGAFHSGEALAQRLDLSRASIWQALQGVEAAGVELYSVRGRGYRLAAPIDWLDGQRIAEAQGASAARFHVELHDEIDSTNTLLMQRAAVGAAHGTVIAAERQTAGRGRLGRRWQGELGGSLMFSLLWRFPFGVAQLSGLSLAVGLAIVQALEQLGVQGAGLKWPNDVLYQGRKLAGVLIEVQGDALGPSCAVIGIGINCRLSAATQATIDQAVTDLAQAGMGAVPRNRLLAAVLGELAVVLARFERDGFAGLLGDWQARHLFHRREVDLLAPSGLRRAVAVLGVDADGALLVDGGAGVETVRVGELSLRAKS